MVVNDCALFQLVVLDDLGAVDFEVFAAPLGDDRAIAIILVDGNDIMPGSKV